jgi:hypothetical protein
MTRPFLPAPLILLAAAFLPSRAAAQQEPAVTRVDITSPRGTPQEPFRTNRFLIPLEFSSDARNGVFFATSEGADIPMSIFLPDTPGGTVGAGLQTDGLKSIRVRVTSTPFGNPQRQATALSEPQFIVLDRTPPTLQLQSIRLRPGGPLEPYDPAREYRTNAPSIEVQGFVHDGSLGVRADRITISVTGIAVPTQVNAQASGLFTITIDISREPEGPVDLEFVADDHVGDGPTGNQVSRPLLLR